MMNKQTLATVFDKYKTDKGPWRHGYHNCYWSIFQDFTPQKMLEIGIFEGRSLAAWKELFPEAQIHGLDTFERKAKIIDAAKDMAMFKGSSHDKTLPGNILLSDYDVIIDDGDHRVDQQWETFLNFQNCWTKYYVIEDVINEDSELTLRRRFKSIGITNITTFTSKFRGLIQIEGKMVDSGFFAMVLKR